MPYTHPSSSVHSNAPVYSSYNTGREDTLHKAQPTVMPPHTAPQHASIYSSHRSSLPPGPSSSMQSSNHVCKFMVLLIIFSRPLELINFIFTSV